MKHLTVFSAFDGAGIGLLALKRACVPVAAYYASEVDRCAIQIAKKNHPEIIHVGDVKKCFARNFPKIDLLIGGSPCQDLSVAKKDRQGLKGPKSKLFWHFVRLLRTMKPRWWMLENVASMSKTDRDEITAVLGVEPVLINSALVSAQQRKRLYWTNIPGITQPADKGILLKDVLETGISPRDKAYCIDVNYWKTLGKNTLDDTHARGRRATVFEQVLYSPYNQSIRKDKAGSLGVRGDSLLNKMGQVVVETLPNKPIKLGWFSRGGNRQGYKIYSVAGKSVCLKSSSSNNRICESYRIDLPDGDYLIRKLTPTECERLQTWPEGYTEGVSNTQRYKMLGNGWTADVVAHILGFIPKEEDTREANH